jgi:hypothetical protein
MIHIYRKTETGHILVNNSHEDARKAVACYWGNYTNTISPRSKTREELYALAEEPPLSRGLNPPDRDGLESPSGSSGLLDELILYVLRDMRP